MCVIIQTEKTVGVLHANSESKPHKELNRPAALNNFDKSSTGEVGLIFHAELDSAHIWPTKKLLIHVHCNKV